MEAQNNVLAPRVKGVCPGLTDPMVTGDGLLTRIRPAGRPVTADQWRCVATIANTLGNGVVELTSRANIQIRGLDTDGLEQAITLSVKAGLSTGDALADQRRGIIVNPLAGNDPDAHHTQSSELATEIVKALTDAQLADLPAKWAIVVDDDGTWPLELPMADLRLVAERDHRWSVCAPHLVGITDRPVEWTVRFAEVCNTHRCRGRDLTVVQRADLLPLQPVGDRPVPRSHSATRPGVRRGRDGGNVVTAPFLGVCTAADIERIAELVDRSGHEPRLTPTRSLAWVHLDQPAIDTISTVCDDLGWLTTSDDDRALVTACIGSLGCNASHIDTHAYAEALVADGVHEPTHLSGCVKQCGAPQQVTRIYATASGMVAVDADKDCT